MVFAPGVFDVFVYQGQDWSLNVAWRINEFQVDPGSFEAAMTVKPSADSKVVVVSLTTENGRVDRVSLPGWLVLSLDRVTTAALPTNRYVYDLVVDDGKSVWPVLRGRFVVRGGLTDQESVVARGVVAYG